MTIPDNTITQTVTIANGASLSGASTKYPGYKLVALVTDSAWDTQKISFAVSNDNSTFYALYDDTGAEVATASTVAASSAVALDPKDFIPWDNIKVRSGLVGAAANQNGATVVTLVFMAL